MPPLDHKTLPKSFISWTPYMTIFSARAERARWSWTANVCSDLGQREFSSGCSGPQLLPWPSQVYNSLSLTIFPTSQLLWGVVFSMAVEGVWSQTPWTYGPSSGNGGGLWWHFNRVLSGVEASCQKIFPPLSGQGEYRLWCWWKSVDGPKQETWLILFLQWIICFYLDVIMF